MSETENLHTPDIPEKPSMALEWITLNGSGSLRRAVEEDLLWSGMYVHERLAMEVATAACAVNPKNIRLTKKVARGDDPTTTEACWYARVLRHRFSQYLKFDTIRVCGFMLNQGDAGEDERKAQNWDYGSGVGLVIEGLELPWLADAEEGTPYMIILPISFWDERENKPTEVMNPC